MPACSTQRHLTPARLLLKGIVLMSKKPHARLRDLHQQAMAETGFEALVIRIVAFRAYGLALRDSNDTESMREFDAMDAELADRFKAASGNPEGLNAFFKAE